LIHFAFRLVSFSFFAQAFLEEQEENKKTDGLKATKKAK